MNSVYLPSRKVRSLAQRKAVSIGVWGGASLLGVVGLIAAFGLPGAAVALCASFVPSVVLKRTVTRYNREAAPALKALSQQRPGAAEGTLRGLRERVRWPRALRNLTGYNLGLALHRQGKHAEAIAELVDVERRGGAANIDPALASSLGLFHVLLGDLDTAEIWLAEAARRYARIAAAVPFPSLLSETALALRRGHYDEARRRLDRDWVEVETTSKGETLRPLRVLRAFAVARSSGVRDAAAVQPYVAALQSARAADFDYLATSWPELRDFLDTAFPTA